MSRTQRERLESLRQAVAHLYEANRVRGHADWNGADYDFVCPSAETYPFQWFWDSCFHAVVLSRLDAARAEAEVRTLLANQQPDGFIPHVTYWQSERPGLGTAYALRGSSSRFSDSMQPPVLAEAVAAVARRGRGAAFLAEVLPAVRRYYDWCDRVRDPDQEGLIAVLEPHETGMDQSPAFDAYVGIRGVAETPAVFEAAWRTVAEEREALGNDPAALFAADRFVVREIATNVLYAENQRVLAGLLAEIGDERGATAMGRRADRTVVAILERCWQPAIEDFCSLAGRERVALPGGTVAGLLPILLPETPAAGVERIAGRLADPRDFGPRYPVPSVSLSHPAYRPAPGGGTLLWRGPTWINTNWYLVRALHRHGRDALADLITDATLALVERAGFREHYNAETGEGYGARGFAWSALALDLLAEREVGDAPLD